MSERWFVKGQVGGSTHVTLGRRRRYAKTAVHGRGRHWIQVTVLIRCSVLMTDDWDARTD